MTMKFTQLKTHWTADDAHDVLSLLDELRDALWETYGADIIEQQQREHQYELFGQEDESDVINF